MFEVNNKDTRTTPLASKDVRMYSLRVRMTEVRMKGLEMIYNNTKRVNILGDSIIKHVKVYDISRSLENCKVCAKDFPGARIRCAYD